MFGKRAAKALRSAILATLISTGCALAQPTPGSQAYHWQSVPYGAGGYVDGFIYHPREKGILYARTDVGGLYRYDFTGRSWVPLLDHLPREDADFMGVLSVAIDPANPDKVYAACGLYLQDWARKGAILRSDDRGLTWKKTELPIRIGGNADGRGTGERLVVDPRDSNTVYFGSNQDGLWRSTDSGATFTKLTASPARSINFLIFEPSSNDLYLASADGKGGLYVSRDKGSTFVAVEGAPQQLPQRAAFAADGTMYVTFAVGDGSSWAVNPSHAEGGKLVRRDPGSAGWKEISPIKPSDGLRGGYSGIDVAPDGTVVVSTLDRWWPHDDVFVSRDKGARWSALSRQARFAVSDYPWLEETNPERRMGGWLSDLKINPFNPDEMTYGHGGGVWTSRNLSAAGTDQPLIFDANIANLEEGAVTQLVSPSGGATILATMGDTAGGAWDDLTKSPKAGLFRPNTETNESIDYAGQRPGWIVRTVHNSKTRGFFSKDGGGSWDMFAATPVVASPPNEPYRGPGAIAISAKGSALVWAPERSGGFHSSDGGKSWSPSAGWPDQREQTLTPIADKVVDQVFYLHDRPGGRILVSVDGGGSFKMIAEGLPVIQSWDRSQLAVTPTRMRDLWIALPGGLVHSRSADTPFKSVKKVEAAWAIGFGAPRLKDGYPTVFVFGKIAGQGGLWRSEDEGVSWLRINDDAHQFGDMRSITGDPLEFGTLYIAPHGRGVMVGRPPVVTKP
ncbi:hypothetical protein [Caulobacter sp. HMWF009]|uniref:WD40/YVTN/BNR-like repeat-containing protein n=1 Tax=Caulobacter sp. HMWF009 TaxID=2056846 RepID=UPI000D36E81F|nr:hypothetical protein [Caulobacter sp. HMWF009]PTS87861.1 hypothetical protein DBR21_11200 [Caulobacter sp. HMWF009]PTT11192.1 hypothetical protein DBR10_04035 [Caulobacter sp. HMWF025]